MRLGGSGKDVFVAWEMEDGTLSGWSKVINKKKRHRLAAMQLQNVESLMRGESAGLVEVDDEEEESAGLVRSRR